MTVKDGLTRRHCTLPTELWALMDKLAAEAGVPFRAAHETAVEAGLRLTPAKVLASTYAADRRRAAPLKKEESAKARRMKKAQEGRDHATAQARKAEVPIILAWVLAMWRGSHRFDGVEDRGPRPSAEVCPPRGLDPSLQAGFNNEQLAASEQALPLPRQVRP